jgi:hypothetical protein
MTINRAAGLTRPIRRFANLRQPSMTARPSLPCRLGAFGWAVLLACLTACPVRAQAPPDPLDPLGRPLLLHDINLWSAMSEAAPAASRTPRLRLPRMPLTSLGDPLGLNPDDDPPPDPDAPPAPPEPDLSRVQLSMGADNPFFDFRRHGSPGGAGYYRVNTQLELFDTGTTGCTLTCATVRPAGLDSNGLNDGPSFVSPALSVFHDLGDGTALHGFVGKDVRANSAWRDGVTSGSVQYGVALQQPLSFGTTNDPGKGLFLFVEAQGRWSDRDPQATRSWELVPGLHYRLGDNWWMSGGVLLPFGPTRDGSAGQWHLSCRWQY